MTRYRRREREINIWRFEELLPIVDARAQARVGRYSGRTPLIHADRLGAELGLKKLYLKDDSTSRPSLSYKDRVVSMAVARLLELGKDEIGCVSTGNVGTAVASLAAKAGVRAYVFYPSNLERGKARACRALGAAVCQLDGNYDQANRACRELALASGIQFANITLRPFYAEGAKTVAYEVVEQLEWNAPDHFVIPAAGGTLSSRVHKGLNELETVGLAETAATKISVAQAEGCGPIAAAILDGSGEIEPQSPHTAAHSLAIGAPGDGPLVVDAVMSRGGYRGDRQRRGDLRRDRPARRHRGHPHRAGRRHHGGLDGQARQRRQARSRRHRRRDHQRQRLQDARRAPRQALGRNGLLRRRLDDRDARRVPPARRRRHTRLNLCRLPQPGAHPGRNAFSMQWMKNALRPILRDAGGGTRTPDTRIMIPLL